MTFKTFLSILSVNEGEEGEEGEEERQEGSTEEYQGDATEQPRKIRDLNMVVVIPDSSPDESTDTESTGSRWGGDGVLQYLRQELDEKGSQEAGYIVLALRSRTSNDPLEKIIKISNKHRLFKDLRKGINFLRGWRGFLSLKCLKQFGLSKCDIGLGRHFNVELSPADKSALSKFFDAYKADMYRPDAGVAEVCSEWIFMNLNGGEDPLESYLSLSLNLIYDWSAFRVSVAVVTPLLLSLAVGIWYMQRHGDVVAAWTISLYIVASSTAAIALLGFLENLKDTQASEPDARFWKDGTVYRRAPRRNTYQSAYRSAEALDGRDPAPEATTHREDRAESLENHEPAPEATVKREEMAGSLENPGARINEIWDNGQTPLSNAAAIGDVGLVKRLLDAGADINRPSASGQIPLSCAVLNGQQEVVKLLLKSEDLHVNARDPSGQTPLSLAIQHGKFVMLRLLLEHGDINVNLADKSNRTPLLWAMKSFIPLAAEILLSNKSIDVTSKDITGQTPLLLASQRGWGTEVKLLLEHNDVDVNSKDKDDRTPLSWAAEKGNIEVLRSLLEHKDIDVNSEDITGRTPLFWPGRHVAVLTSLLEHKGIIVDPKNKLGQTPLSLAAENGDEETVRVLLGQAGVNVNSQDNNGRTPLSWAAQYGHETVTRLLLGHNGVMVNLADNNGQTPRLWAEQSGKTAVKELLLDFEKQAKAAEAVA